MSPYSTAALIRILCFLMHLCPLVCSSHVASAVSHSRRAQGDSTGVLIVRQTNTQPGEFSTISAAVEALKGLKGPQKIFINPGTYREQVQIKYKNPLEIQGYSQDSHSLSQNRVVIEIAVSAASLGGENAASAAVWVRSPSFKMSNVNLINSYGTGTDTQALALAAQGEKHVYKYCLFSSYQDTVNIKTASSFFFGCRIEGAVDFIFGPGTAWFEMCDIVVKTPKSYATITAQQATSEESSIFVFNKSRVIPKDTTNLTSSTYLGRPWGAYATVMFQSCYLSEVVHPAGWIQWSSQHPRTEHTNFQESGNYGPGAPTKQRRLSSSNSQPRKIENVLGSDYQSWAN